MLTLFWVQTKLFISLLANLITPTHAYCMNNECQHYVYILISDSITLVFFIPSNNPLALLKS